MIGKSTEWVVEAAGGRLVAGDPAAPGPDRVVVDSRKAGRGDLFVGLRGERADGGAYAHRALDAEAWGVIVGPHHAAPLRDWGGGAVIEHDDPLAALASLARAWRRELHCPAIGVTGSTGKTSTKDILAALLRPHLRTHANRENFNTEIGLPLSLLDAPPGTEVLVLEMAMRGEGQIAELVSIAEPEVGVIVNVGPVHLELLGTLERVAAAKAELIRDLPPGASCVVPAGDPLLARHLRDDLDTITFGPGGQVRLDSFEAGRAVVSARGTKVELDLPYSEPYNLRNTLAAVAAATALGVTPGGAVDVRFSSLRGELVELEGGVTVVNDCYNANPMSMRAALETLAETPAARRIAVLGHMAELGPDSDRFHHEIGSLAARLGIDLLVTVGSGAAGYEEEFGGESYSTATPAEAGALLAELAEPGDRVLIKGSRSAGLEQVLGAVTGASGA